MHSVSYETKGEMTLDNAGRPTVPVIFVQQSGANWHSHSFGNMLVDSGAAVTSLSKEIADDNAYPIIKSGWPVLMGFTDLARVSHDLVKLGKTESEAREYLRSFFGKGNELLTSLKNDFGITGIGIVCDLRRVSFITLNGFTIEDVVVATPHDDNIEITEVLGMNVLEKFSMGMDFDNDSFYLRKRTGCGVFVPDDFKCGDVSVEEI